MRLDKGKFFVGGLIALLSVTFVSGIDKRLGTLLLVIYLLLALYVYRTQFFAGIAAFFGAVEGLA